MANVGQRILGAAKSVVGAAVGTRDLTGRPLNYRTQDVLDRYNARQARTPKAPALQMGPAGAKPMRGQQPKASLPQGVRTNGGARAVF